LSLPIQPKTDFSSTSTKTPPKEATTPNSVETFFHKHSYYALSYAISCRREKHASRQTDSLEIVAIQPPSIQLFSPSNPMVAVARNIKNSLLSTTFIRRKLTHDLKFFRLSNHPTLAIRRTFPNSFEATYTAEQLPATDALITVASLAVSPTSPCRFGGYSRVRPSTRHFSLCYGKYEFSRVQIHRAVLLEFSARHLKY